MLSEQKPLPTKSTFSLLRLYDRFTPQSVWSWQLDSAIDHNVISSIQRWPARTSALGGKTDDRASDRQFVFAAELVTGSQNSQLLTGNILAHVAAQLPPLPTGFWDRIPQRTPGRLRRLLGAGCFSRSYRG